MIGILILIVIFFFDLRIEVKGFILHIRPLNSCIKEEYKQWIFFGGQRSYLELLLKELAEKEIPYRITEDTKKIIDELDEKKDDNNG